MVDFTLTNNSGVVIIKTMVAASKIIISKIKGNNLVKMVNQKSQFAHFSFNKEIAKRVISAIFITPKMLKSIKVVEVVSKTSSNKIKIIINKVKDNNSNNNL